MQLIAHRGLTTHAPENSLEAIKAAVNAGFRAVEFDVRASRDGTFYILHDASLNRTTNMRGKLAKKTDRELKDCTLANGERLPLLETVLRFLSKSKIKTIYLEYKDRGAEEGIVATIKRHHLEKRTIIEQFSIRSLRKFHALDCRLRLLFVCPIFFAPQLRLAKSCGCTAVGTYRIAARRSVVKRAHAMGLRFTIYPLKKKEHAAHAKRLGADAAFVDYLPERF